MINNIIEKFKKYKVSTTNESMEKLCLPQKFKLQPQQLFIADLLSSKYSPWNQSKNIRGILLYHQLGSGKTCTAINIAEQFINKLNIMVILPASLVDNFYTELRSECTNDKYVKNNERKIFNKLHATDKKYEELINKINKRINKYYTIYSYHKFISLIQTNKLKNLNNTLLIIDEIQNMISLHGTFYKNLSNIINNSNDSLKIVVLSGTPIFDKPIEIGLILNLLKKNDLIPITNFNQQFIDRKVINKKIQYNMINKKIFNNKIKYLISYYRGAPPQTYPNTEFKIIKCNMSDFQYKSYLTSLSSENNFIKGSFKDVDILNLPQNFFLGPRMISNVAFPNKSIGELGFNSFKADNLKLKNIKNYSIKFYKILQKIKKVDGPIFIYSNFKELGGIKSFIKFLEYHKWKNYKNYGEGINRFVIWSGDETIKYKHEIKYIFNHINNANGSKIKIILGSPSIKEGVSLLRVQQVHIIEPYWNMSRMLQIIGRAVRFCSHKDVPKNKRIVKIYLYLAVYNGEKTIDQYIWSLAQKKNKLIKQFEYELKNSAIDCEILYNRNNYITDQNKIECIK